MHGLDLMLDSNIRGCTLTRLRSGRFREPVRRHRSI